MKNTTEWSVGQRVLSGNYEILALLGEGSRGRVYKAHFLPNAAFVAIKQPRAGLVDEPGARDSFRRDLRAWARLSSRHIVSLHAIEVQDGVPLMVSEFVDGGNLHDWIRGGRLHGGGPGKTLERILAIAGQIASGVAYVHETIGPHQDLKPSNVLMMTKSYGRHAADPGAPPPRDVEPRPMLTDFALANAWENARRADATFGHSSWPSIADMTPACCAPEQMRHESASAATNVWSWAAIVLEMFVGGASWKPGFAAEGLEDFIENPRPESGLTMPPALIHLLRGCLVRDPGERPKLHDVQARLAGR